MVVLLGGAALGPRLGMLSQVLYIALGIAGFPVFAVSPLPQGVLRLLGPTGGYLMSYPFAAYLTGALAERGFDRNYRTSVLAMGAGLALIFACGIAWLAWFTRPVPAGLDAALRTGLYPFLPADIVKICLAAGVMPSIWALLGRRSSSGDSRPQDSIRQEARLPDLLISDRNALCGRLPLLSAPPGAHRAVPGSPHGTSVATRLPSPR